MQFYPNNDLYKQYNKYNIYSWLSPRIRDHSARRSMDLLNLAINTCERWGSFLDIGAGSGRVSIPLLRKFKNGHAVEVCSSDELSKVGQVYGNFKVHIGMLQKLKLKEKINFVAMFDVFEHIPVGDVHDVLKNISAFQELGGVIFVLTPNAVNCGPAEESGIYYKRHKYGHHKQYTRVELESIFQKHKYTLVFTSYLDTHESLLLRKICLFLSITDKKLLSIPGYGLLTLPFVFILNTVLRFFGILANQTEKRAKSDEFATRSIVMVFKKL